MTWKNSTDSWGRAARGLHWLTAVLLAAQFIIGWVGPEMSPSPLKIEVMTGHKSLGITILFLLLTRLLWRWLSPPPSPAAGIGRWARRLSAAVHALMYLLGCALALSGWMAASTALVPWKLWWLLPWPRLAAPDKVLHETFASGHEWLSWLLLSLIIGHVLAALRHHFLKKSDVLKRMWSGGLLTCALLLAPLVAGAAGSQSWSSPAEAGELAFTARYESQELTGLFRDFQVRLERSGDEISRLLVVVDTGTADMNDEEVNAALATREWFDSGVYAEAVFESNEIIALGKRDFVARGVLKLKGQSHPLEVPFHWQADAARAKLEGRLEMARLKWHIGSGEWADTSTIADTVEVRFLAELELVD